MLMPKLKPTTPSKIITLLEQHGFELKRTKGSHRIYHNPETKRLVIVPFHKRDLPKGTLRAILKDAGLSPDDL